MIYRAMTVAIVTDIRQLKYTRGDKNHDPSELERAADELPGQMTDAVTNSPCSAPFLQQY